MAQPTAVPNSGTALAAPNAAFVPAPPSQATKDRIALLAKYVVQNGGNFLEMVRSKHANDPQYAFLNPGGLDHDFYQWALFCATHSLPLDQPPPAGFAPQSAPAPGQQAGLPPQQHAAAQHSLQQQQQPQHQQQEAGAAAVALMPAEVSQGFSQVLDALNGSKDSIRNSQSWFMACEAYAAGMAHMMAARAAALTDFDRQLHLIYLANDILFKAHNREAGQQQAAAAGGAGPASGASEIARAFAPVMGPMLAAAARVAGGGAAGDGARGRLERMVVFWREKGVFTEAVLESMEQEMKQGAAAATGAQGQGQAQPQQQQQQVHAEGDAAAAAPAQPQQAMPPAGPNPHQHWQAAQAYAHPPPGWPAAAGAPPAAWPGYPGGAWYPPGAAPPYGAPAPPQLQAPHAQHWYAAAREAAAASGAPQPPHPYPLHAQPPPYPAPGAPPPHHAPPPQQPYPPGAGYPAHPAGGHYPPDGHYPHHHPQPHAYPPHQAPHYYAAQPPQPPQPPTPVPEPEPEPQPVSSVSFPPGLIPQLVREKTRYSEPYTPLDASDLEKITLPPPPQVDAYLSARWERFEAELRDWRPGRSRAELEEARERERLREGRALAEEDDYYSSGDVAAARRMPRGLSAPVGGMLADGSYVGAGAGEAHVGLGAHASAHSMGNGGGEDDVYSTYRRSRSGAYHTMILSNVGQSNMARGGR